MRRLALLAAVAVLALAAPPLASAHAAAGSATVSYKPPVDGPIVDPFRPPANRWDSGNRGVDYATDPGAPVRAAADGEVVFAGSVGGQLHVVLLHADGIRTSYSFLQAIAVHRGDRLRQGEPVGFSGDRLHFGARLGDDYVDPTALFDRGPPNVFLVPDDVRRPASEAAERAGLARFLGPLGRFAKELARQTAREVGDTVIATFEEVRGVAQWAQVTNPIRYGTDLARRTAVWWAQRDDCTPAGTTPPPLPERRVAVLVGGLDSSSQPFGANIVDVDAAGLGYVDTVRFSYAGGTIFDNPYDSGDTTADLREMGVRLKELLAQVHRDHPGEAVDILAHSQGGLIARSALAYGFDPADDRYPRVANLITLGTPHTGADLATAVRMFGFTGTGEHIEEVVAATGILPFDITGPSMQQMSETSWFLIQLNHTPLPDGIRFTSIGARDDLVVPAVHTTVKGATNVVVSSGPGWFDDHSNLPGSEAARREVALAAAGLPPTCESFTNMIADYWTSTVISSGEDALGAALYASGRWFDRYYGGQAPPVALPTRRKP